MSSKIITFIQLFYKFVQISFCFWLYLLKGLVVYSLIPTLAALLSTVHELQTGKDVEDIKGLYKKHFIAYRQYRIQSFVFVSVIIVSYTSLFFLNRLESNLTLMPIILVLYILALTLIVITYLAYILVFKKMPFKQSLALAFVSSIRKPIHSVMIGIVLVLLFISAAINLVIFVVLGPFLYGLTTKIIISNSKLLSNEVN